MLVAGIQIQVVILSQWSLPPGGQAFVQHAGRPAHLRGGHRRADQLLGDGCHLAGRDALHVHLRQRQHQGPFAAQPFLQRFRVEAAFTNLGYGKGDLAHSGLHHLGFVAVGLAASHWTAFKGGSIQVLLALQLHGFVDQDADHLR